MGPCAPALMKRLRKRHTAYLPVNARASNNCCSEAVEYLQRVKPPRQRRRSVVRRKAEPRVQWGVCNVVGRVLRSDGRNDERALEKSG